jgi:hypothetical protein
MFKIKHNIHKKNFIENDDNIDSIFESSKKNLYHFIIKSACLILWDVWQYNCSCFLKFILLENT